MCVWIEAETYQKCEFLTRICITAVAAQRTPQQVKKVNQHSDFIDNVRSTRSERGSSTGCGKTMRTTPKSSSCA